MLPSLDQRSLAEEGPLWRFFQHCPIDLPPFSVPGVMVPMIVSNCVPPLVIPTGKQAVFHKMDAQFETRIRMRVLVG
jgi:hypothetical protein